MAENQVYLIKSGSNSFVEETEAVVGISGGKVGIGTTHPEADLHVTGSVKVGGDLTVDGTFTTINSNTISVDDKNIELGSTENPTDATADGGGITVKGAPDKTFNWLDATDAWTSSEHLYLANGKHFSADELRALDSDGLKLADATTSGVLIKGGKVGIHQATPAYDLDVDGSGNFTSLYVDGNAVLTGEGSIFGKWEDGTSEGEIFYTGGNVGVGTDNPEYPFHVFGNSVVDGNFIVNGESGNLNVSKFNVSGDSITLNYRGGALASDRGGLIVNDSNNASKSFEYVEGSDFWNSNVGLNITNGGLNVASVSAVDVNGLTLGDDAGNGIFVEDGGQIGINTTSPNYNLHVNGSTHVGGEFSVGSEFKISAGGAVGGTAPASNGDIIKWDDADNKWVAGANVGGGGGGGVGEVPLATINSLPSGQSIYEIEFAETYNVEPRIATQLEIDGEGSIIPYVVSGVSTSGYHLIFAQDIPNNNYRIHTTFGGRDVHWETGAGASLYYNDGDVSIQRNFTIGGNLTVNGTTTTVNTETVEIEDHNLVIAANTGYNQLDSQYPAGGAYAGVLWGTGDAGGVSPVSLTYQTNKGFAFEGGNVGIGTAAPDRALHVYSGNDNPNTILESSDTAVTLRLKDSTGAAEIECRNDFRFSNNAGADEIMRLTTDGEVGIGIADPAEKLSVLGNIKIVKNLSGNPSNEDILGSIGFEGSNSINTNLASEAKIEAIAEADHTGTSAATGLQFYTKKSTTGPGSQASPSMRIAANGNVGIGTTSPDTNLHIEVKDNSSGIDSANNRPGAVLRLTHDAQWQAAYGSPTSNVDYLGGIEFETKDSSGGVGVRTAIKTTVDHYANANSLVFYTAPNSTAGILERLRIQGDNGYVGIGTTSPNRTLEVAGNIRATKTTVDGGNIALDLNVGGSSDHPTLDIYDKDGNDGARITANGNSWLSAKGGNVGIGTTDPGKPLHIAANAHHIVLEDTNGTAGSKMVGIYNNNQQLYLGRYSDDNFNDFTTNLFINATGDVGIGTTSPAKKLDVNTWGRKAPGTAIIVSGNAIALTTEDMSSIISVGDTVVLANNNGTSDTSDKVFTVSSVATDSVTFTPAPTFSATLHVFLLESTFNVGSGRVGIGTTNPDQILTIRPTQVAKYGVHVIKPETNDSLGGIFVETDGSSSLYLKDGDSTGISAVRVKAEGDSYFTGGNVGIGTKNPGGKLHANYWSQVTGTVTVSADSDAVTGTNTLFTSEFAQYDTIKINGETLYVSTINSDTSLTLTANHEGGAAGSDAYKTSKGLWVGNVTEGYSGAGTLGSMVVDYNGLSNIALTNSKNDAYTYISHNGDRFKIQNSYGTSAGKTPISLSASGGDDIFIKTDGNVGIGTTNPSTNLEVLTSASAYSETAGISTYGITINDPVQSSLNLYHGGSGSALSRIVSLRSSSSNSELAFITQSSAVGRTEKMRIDPSGNVGIGTTNPGSKLDLNNGTSPVDLQFTETSTAYHKLGIRKDGTLLQLGEYNNSGDTFSESFLTIDAASNGNVGIGTTNPRAPLEVDAIKTYDTAEPPNVTAVSGGIIVPRMTSSERALISSPTDGEIIYNTTDNRFEFRQNGQWVYYAATAV